MKTVSLLGGLPVRYKLILVIVLTSGAALLLASLALIGSNVVNLRARTASDLVSLAALIADNSAMPLSSDDSEAAREILDGLHSREHIMRACITGPSGVFARYARAQLSPECPEGEAGATDWTPQSVGVFRPVMLAGSQIGTVYVQSDLDETYSNLRLQIGSFALVLVISMFFAFALSAPVERVISRPILTLLQTTRTVTQSDNYAVRATRSTDDEMGQLVDSFNLMLAKVEERDAQLRQAKDELEERVSQRTEQLQHELAERRRAEEELVRLNKDLQRSNKELDDFAYVASHDLKEPLRGIHSYAVFLLEDYGEKLDAEAKARLETLKRLSQRMDTLIDSLLHYARVGRLDMAYEWVDPNEIVSDVREVMDARFGSQAIDIRVPRPLPKIWADRTRMGEVFHNLIINAVKYNEASVKRVEVGVVDPDAVDYVFYVRDNGIGIPARHLESIFRIFKRLHARDKFGGGTGAGLTIVRKIIERHNGRVWAESVDGQGSTFYFTIHS